GRLFRLRPPRAAVRACAAPIPPTSRCRRRPRARNRPRAATPARAGADRRTQAPSARARSAAGARAARGAGSARRGRTGGSPRACAAAAPGRSPRGSAASALTSRSRRQPRLRPGIVACQNLTTVVLMFGGPYFAAESVRSGPVAPGYRTAEAPRMRWLSRRISAIAALLFAVIAVVGGFDLVLTNRSLA